ncbi:MAG: FAA hydrolase family protein [Myxococcales bacterium]|nr:FAA hydrolase family protein [Myxococcales bacterium]
MPLLFRPAAAPSLAILGTSTRFPVRRIWCIGRNYAAHAREMGMDAREPPFFFAKPGNALVAERRAGAGVRVPYPPATADLHFETELVAALHRGGRDIPTEVAPTLVFGYGVGLDLTRRDLQAEARKAGKPWDMAKGFDASAPVSALAPVASVGHPADWALRLEVNGCTRQAGTTTDMIWSVAEAIAALSRLVELRPGDLLFTGTPDGVGAIVRGDRLHARVAAFASLDVVID